MSVLSFTIVYFFSVCSWCLLMFCVESSRSISVVFVPFLNVMLVPFLWVVFWCLYSLCFMLPGLYCSGEWCCCVSSTILLIVLFSLFSFSSISVLFSVVFVCPRCIISVLFVLFIWSFLISVSLLLFLSLFSFWSLFSALVVSVAVCFEFRFSFLLFSFLLFSVLFLIFFDVDSLFFVFCICLFVGEASCGVVEE